MQYCDECGTSLGEDADECPVCGTSNDECGYDDECNELGGMSDELFGRPSYLPDCMTMAKEKMERES